MWAGALDLKDIYVQGLLAVPRADICHNVYKDAETKGRNVAWFAGNAGG